MSDSEIMEAAKKFAAIIQETDTYKEYYNQREKVKKQPELYDKVNEFRQKNFDLQNESDSEDLFDRMEAFDQEYAKFRENPLVDDFLRAELAFCRMMQDVEILLAAEIDFE
ncbi:MAG: YlbF family regulator [Lachnospiraceae bacterium]|nr:YlbF family regulator [Lachnospiraceae bacterium]MBD5503183.1 YlbF family regulator [Lachnospiraceae bacterium]MDE6740128.1 YlbF family regulator [Lachnospiraceae bacterium]MDE7259961.1 YlbF family regulator [Lachnospiraceae bacterium]